MKKFLALLVFLGAALQLWAQPRINMARAAEAQSKIQRLVEEHPEPLVSRDLLGWVKTGKVKFAINRILPEMSSSLEATRNGPQIYLWCNQDYLLEVPPVSRPADKQALLRLVIYHEAKHISDHIQGNYKLRPLFPKKGEVPPDLAQRMWDMEWSAVSAEWELAKKWDVRYLVPVIAEATRNVDNPRSFLEGFYRLQMAGTGVLLDPSLGPQYRAIYEREKAKISSMYR